jgi:GAF domain-containing protein
MVTAWVPGMAHGGQGARLVLSYPVMPEIEPAPLPVPLLHPATRLEDIETLKAWYEAVADSLRAEMSFDLFALWLFRPDGEPLLIEPEALEKDHLTVPAAHPTADDHALAKMEDRVRRAGYGSVVVQPIRREGADVALMLIAGFSPSQIGRREVELVGSAARSMSPILARVVQAHLPPVEVPQSPPDSTPPLTPPPPHSYELVEPGVVPADESFNAVPEAEALPELEQGDVDETASTPIEAAGPTEEPPPVAELAPPEVEGEAEPAGEISEPGEPEWHGPDPTLLLYEAVADALAGAGAPRDLMLAVSYALQEAIPHDSFELIVPDQGMESWYRMGLHGHGPLWADPALVRGPEWLVPESLFGESFRLFLPDTIAPGIPRVPELVTVRGEELPPRSLIGVKLRVVERAVGYLLLGSALPGGFTEDQLILLDRLGALLAPRVDGFILAWQYTVLRGQFDLIRHLPMHLSRTAELLALTPVLGEGTRLFLQQAQALLPVHQLEFAVRLSEEGRVAIVRPGFSTPMADLPQESIEGSGVGAVVRGESPYMLTTQEDKDGAMTVLVVPLRAGGRIFGAMAVTGRGPSPFTRTDMAVARALADLIGPHLDLARRVGQAPPVFTGWRRSTGKSRTLGEIERGVGEG